MTQERYTRRRHRSTWVGCALVLIGLVVAGQSAGADPSRNGLIVYTGITTENAKPEIYAFPVAGGQRLNLSRNLGWDDEPALSPDGTKLVFTRAFRDWVVARADGTGQRRLDLHRSDVDGSWPGPATWAPDSRHVVGSMADNSVESVVVVDTETSAAERVGRGRAPQWAPRGAIVAYTGPDGLYVAALGQSPALLVRGAGDFSWSPEGTRIAYRDGSRALGVVDVATDVATVLTTTQSSGPIAWSPDGSRIFVVATDGSFRSVPSTGGAASAFGSPTSQTQTIAVSPTGKLLALVNAGRLTLTTPEGTVVSEFGAGLNPSWSPSGAHLAFVRNEALQVVDVASRKVRALANPQANLVWKFPYLEDTPVWRPDGSAVIAPSVAASLDTRLFVTSADGRAVKALPPRTKNTDEPAWAPDGHAVAFASSWPTRTIVVADDGLRHVRAIARHGTEPAWSPDGSSIAYAGVAPRSGGIFVVGADGRGRRRVTSGLDGSPSWSPNGATLAFARSSLGRGDAGVYLQRLAGGPAHEVFSAGQVGANDEPGEVVSVSWSPTDNRRLAFRLTSLSPPHFYDIQDDEIVVVELRAGRTARVVSRISPAGTTVSWSPDGRFLLHGSYDDPSFGGDEVPWVEPELTDNHFRITRPNGHAVGLLTLPQRAASPSWQPLCTRSGSGGADGLQGGSGDDVLCGLGGNDAMAGGPGRDRLFGESGNDTIDAHDGTFDVVGCGPGVDTVRADAVDLVGTDCERVTRS